MPGKDSGSNRDLLEEERSKANKRREARQLAIQQDRDEKLLARLYRFDWFMVRGGPDEMIIHEMRIKPSPHNASECMAIAKVTAEGKRQVAFRVGATATEAMVALSEALLTGDAKLRPDEYAGFESKAAPQ